MKTLKFNINSIHFKLANFAGYDKYETPDLCTYIRYVILGVVLCAASIAFGSFLFTPVVFGITAIIVSFMWGFSVLDEGAWIGILFMLIPITLFLAYKSKKFVQCIVQTQKKPPSTDNFLISAYKSVKYKYCVRIEFKD